ncbi:MAG TPA: SMC-Scp complex subunit ScpB [Nitrospira sp.]|nr:SMC-Scp complex subunit ScpB [Nitrospira sp.]
MTPPTADVVQEVEVPETEVVNGANTEEIVNMEGVNGAPHVESFTGERPHSMAELQAILEALLFVSAEPLPVNRLVAVLGTVSKGEVEEALHHLARALDQEGRGVRLVAVAGGYRLVTKQDYASWVKRLDKAKTAAKLSRSALESLAIIAYKQPLVRAEVEEIRGVEASGVIRTLLERKLVRIVGRKEVPGRPIMYGTTKFFLEHFGLSDLSQLPPLREFKELGEAEQALLPMDGAESQSVESADDGAVATVNTVEAEVEPSVSDELPAAIPLEEAFDPLSNPES